MEESASALVVEGGAMRGIFAAGVLDGFMENDYRPFSSAWGVSAGSTNLIGYLCNDPGRSYRVITGHACQPEFINWQRFARGGHLCDVHWLWHQSYSDVPLSLGNYLTGNVPLWVNTTSVVTGEARYFRIDQRNMHDVLTASCSIPLAYRDFPLVEDEPMSDGGLADAIPVERAYRQGARDITVVLSRPLGYRKKQGAFPGLTNRVFRKHPALARAFHERADRYNSALDFAKNPPPDCHVRVIAPPDDFPVGRLTKDRQRLADGYRQGREAAWSYLEAP